jgi:hypothetical protein
MPTLEQPPPTYSFSPPEASGWMLGLTGAQVVVLGCAFLLVLAMSSAGAPVPVDVLGVVAGVVVAFARVGGQSALAQAPALAAYLLRRHAGRDRWEAPLTLMGEAPDPDAKVTAPALPPSLDGLVIVAADPAGYGPGARPCPIGVVHDTGAGTWSATFAAAGESFQLLSDADQAHRLATFGQALDAFCAERFRQIVNVRWAAWRAPAGANDLLAWWGEHRHPDAVPGAEAAYAGLLAHAGPASTRHEVLVTVTCADAPARVRGRHRGDAVAASCGAVLDELRLLGARLQAASVAVTPPLNPGELARAMAVRIDPSRAPGLDALGRSLTELSGQVPAAHAGPMASLERWDHWRTDATVHRAFQVQRWPMTPVGATFMGGLLLSGQSVFTLAVLYEPVGRRQSSARTRRDAAKAESERRIRAQHGLYYGSGQQRQADAAVDRDSELAHGYGEFDFVGVVMVSAPAPPNVDDLPLALDDACEGVIQAAGGAGLELRPLSGNHAVAASCCLPVPRSLAPRWR